MDARDGLRGHRDGAERAGGRAAVGRDEDAADGAVGGVAPEGLRVEGTAKEKVATLQVDSTPFAERVGARAQAPPRESSATVASPFVAHHAACAGGSTSSAHATDGKVTAVSPKEIEESQLKLAWPLSLVTVRTRLTSGTAPCQATIQSCGRQKAAAGMPPGMDIVLHSCGATATSAATAA